MKNRKAIIEAMCVLAGFLGIGAIDCLTFIHFPTVALWITMGLSALVGTLAGVGYFLIYGEHGR